MTAGAEPPTSWSADQLRLLDASRELRIRPGDAIAWTPIWVVTAGGAVFVRTWHLRTTGWYGRARRSGTAAIRVPGLEIAVLVVAPARHPSDDGLVDAAFRTKYGEGAVSMTTEEAVASTLRLDPA